MMITDPNLILAVAGSGLAGLALTAFAASRAWAGWLELKRAELAGRVGEAAPPSPMSRIEIADLKERVRKLEQIAAGVDI